MRIRKVDDRGVITTVAGNGNKGYSGDGGPATSASLLIALGVAIDKAGNLYIADGSRIRKVSPSGIIATIAGNGGYGYSGDGGPALDAELYYPEFMAVDNISGNVFAGEIFNNVIRELIPENTEALLTIRQTYSTNLSDGEDGVQYSILVSNAANAGPTTSLVTVTETVPTAYTLVSITGSGWNCSLDTCTRGDVLMPGSSYPPIIVTFDIPVDAPVQADNQVSVTGGGSAAPVATSDAVANVGPAEIGAALQFVPITPCRIADTRSTDGPSIAGGSSRDFSFPDGICGVPATAAAYALNVTVVPAGPLGYLTVWPTGEAQPTVSTLNSLDGRIKANAAIMPAGANGGVSVFATNTTDVVLDVNGYFVPASVQSALAFYPVTPCRLVDTRIANGSLGSPSLAGGATRDFPLLTSSCGIPSTAQAYSLNFTVVPDGPLGYITVWPSGQFQPFVSTLNAQTGEVTANAAIVPAGTNGDIDVFASNSTDLVIDINGYFAPPGRGGLSLYTASPCRVLDTRNAAGAFSGTLAVNVMSSACGTSNTAEAYVFNATVVPSSGLGYLTLWPDGQSQPFVSTLNAIDGSITSNMAIVPTTNGSINAFATNPTQLILDISGFFAP